MQQRSFFPLKILIATAILFLGAIAEPSNALAGFQWVAPATQEQGGGLPQVYAAPQETVAPVVPYPQQDQQPSPQLQMQQLTYHERKEIERSDNGGIADQSLSMSSAQTTPSYAAPAAPPAASFGKDKAVQGFANNVPLAVALRQVLPADISFSVGKNVDLSTLVSWRGGESWRQTVNNMLQPAGLSMREQGQSITVVRSQDAGDGGAVSQPFSAGASSQTMGDSRPMQLLPSTLPESSSFVNPPTYAAPQVGGGSQSLDPSVDSWSANRGDTLRKVLEDWSRRANIEVSWQAEYDYPLQASVSVTGTYEEAVRGLLAGFQEAQPQPIGSLHNNQTAGQTVLVVQTRGNNYSD